jgi:hypothetical protein
MFLRFFVSSFEPLNLICELLSWSGLVYECRKVPSLYLRYLAKNRGKKAMKSQQFCKDDYYEFKKQTEYQKRDNDNF